MNSLNSKKASCNEHLIADFVADHLTDTQQATLETHLDDCQSCREMLQSQVAEQSTWDKATVCLRDDPHDLEPPSSIFLNASDGPENYAGVNSVLQGLAASDDPNMLGRLDGYEISGVIGFGGMGVVLKGFDTSLKRVIAIKVLAPHLASSGAARKRFAREAQAAAAITHDNVIDIFSVSEANGQPYLAMPYARGMSLQKRIDQHGPLPVIEILRIGTQIAAGLAAAHEQGLVHRDIKPANILLNDGVDRLVITDFGLARAVDDASVTRTGVIAGTPQYMSPEQARGDSIDHRSDLFSLGSVLYTLCTGRVPFRAESAFGILRRITDNQPRPIRETNAAIPDWLCRVVARLHAKSPDDRYRSAAEVAELLQKCLGHVQSPSTPLPAELRLPEPSPGSLHQNWLKVALATAVVTAMGAIVMMTWPSQPAESNLARPAAKASAMSSPTAKSDLTTTWDEIHAGVCEDILQKARALAEETKRPLDD